MEENVLASEILTQMNKGKLPMYVFFKKVIKENSWSNSHSQSFKNFKIIIKLMNKIIKLILFH